MTTTPLASETHSLLAPSDSSSSKVIIPGKESRACLNFVHKWLESFPERVQKSDTVQVLGTDIEGRSRLVCRYITPQMPPRSLIQDCATDAFAIEKAAR